MNRVRDESEDVRSSLYLNITNHSIIRQFSIKQRRFLLVSGLKDRSEKVQESCKKMVIFNWLKNDDILTLLTLLDCESEEESVWNELLYVFILGSFVVIDALWRSTQGRSGRNHQTVCYIEAQPSAVDLLRESVLALKNSFFEYAQQRAGNRRVYWRYTSVYWPIQSLSFVCKNPINSHSEWFGY